MSGLIKAIKNKVVKAFKFVKKVVKKITSSKVFKAVAVAAAIYFTAGAAAGFLAPTAAASTAGSISLGAGVGSVSTGVGAAALAPGAGVLAAGNGGLALAGASGGIGSTIMGAAKGLGTLAAKHSAITSAALTTGGTIFAGQAKAKAEQKAYEQDKADLAEANATHLPVAERLSKLNQKFAVGGNQQGKVAGSYYDPRNDTYRELA